MNTISITGKYIFYVFLIQIAIQPMRWIFLHYFKDMYINKKRREVL